MPTPRPQFLFPGPTDSNGLPTTYVDGWQGFTNLTDAQQAWFRSQPQWLVKYAGIKRWQKEIAGITVGGIPIITTADNLALLTGLCLRAQRDQASNSAATYAFTANGTAVSLNIAQALGIFDAASGFIQAMRGAEKTLIDGINSKTITSEAQIDSALAAVATAI